MPPVRTLAAAKPIKTERTHEENQERAYIAASRRSDRSLEARVESARRASEIHKRRTGRSLRVTEQDVVNEEMYEEEDDDLPMQYRRLTAHLQTGSADFNRRLAAYLTNHVAMRSALDQAITSSYAQQYPGAPHFAHNSQYPPSFPTPITNPMMPPQMIHRSPSNYRQSPYPSSNPQGFRPQQHQRSASIATTQELPGNQQAFALASPTEGPKHEEARRMSLPAQSSTTPVQMPTVQQEVTQSCTSPQASPHVSRNSSSQNLTSQGTTPHGFFKQEAPQSENQSSQVPQQMYPLQSPTSFPSTTPGFNYSPFATSLPAESQMLLGSALDPNDPFTSMLMSGSDRTQQPFYSYNPNPSSKSRTMQPHPSYDGMNQTLAPGALDTNLDNHNFSNPPSAASEGVISPFTPGFGFNLDGSFSDAFKAPALTRSNSGQGSGGGITPGLDREWTSFVDGNFWEDPAGTS
ncbi:hypothetical protein EV356DRAFT_22246 [Viridothelium virens]|uniref:Uncharacterized protein n=1 Tax=Viridothelium virens TaxID=1048519 RepID=A0A6A6GTM1_VIRVR|nr:hypothetical protein EV356DRAFT_22246 [Viridothelium virens]